MQGEQSGKLYFQYLMLETHCDSPAPLSDWERLRHARLLLFFIIAVIDSLLCNPCVLQCLVSPMPHTCPRTSGV